jgi:hypothetical protein
MYQIQYEDRDINSVLDDAKDIVNEGKTKFPEMIYEEGVVAGIEWIVGLMNGNPLGD